MDDAPQLFPNATPPQATAPADVDLTTVGDWVVLGAYRRDELDVRDMAELGERYVDTGLADAAELWADTNDPERYSWSPGSTAWVYAAPVGGGTLYLVRLRMRAGEHGTGDAKVLSASIEGTWTDHEAQPR